MNTKSSTGLRAFALVRKTLAGVQDTEVGNNDR